MQPPFVKRFPQFYGEIVHLRGVAPLFRKDRQFGVLQWNSIPPGETSNLL